MADSKDTITSTGLNTEFFIEDPQELDDPYLELFDRINQMALDIESLEMDVKELQELVKILKPSTFQWSQWPVGAAMGDGGNKNINTQAEFKFFE